MLGQRPDDAVTSFVHPATVQERVFGVLYYLKGRYVRAAFRHPSLFTEGLRHQDLGQLLQRAEELEFSTPVMSLMRQMSVAKQPSEFAFGTERLPYLYSDFNHAWGTERTVEVPVIWSRVQRTRPSGVLEVGNVLSHYYPTSHLVVDKYETAPGVINQDITEYVPERPMDLIVSISTVEHIGWDDVPRDRRKLAETLERFRSWLAPSGEAWVTVPIGYNRWLDEKIASGTLGDCRRFFLRRVSFDNRWEECSYGNLSRVRYGGPIDRRVDRPPFPRANAVGIFVFGPGS